MLKECIAGQYKQLQIKISAMSDLMLKAARTIAYETGSAPGPKRAAMGASTKRRLSDLGRQI